MDTGRKMDNFEETRHQAALLNPIHTETTNVPYSTPWDVRLGLTLIPARYVLRALTDAVTSTKGEAYLRRYTGVDWLITQTVEKSLHRDIEANLGKIAARFDEFFPRSHFPTVKDFRSDGEILKYLNRNPEGAEILKINEQLHRRWGASDTASNTAEHYLIAQGQERRQPGYSGVADTNKISSKSKKKIKGSMSGLFFGLIYDNLLGVGSAVYTNHVQKNVVKDIISVYSEAVGFELGKDPHDVTKEDIGNSTNPIIQSTIDNYNSKRWQRIGITALPFMRNIPILRPVPLGDLAVGGWGASWAYNVWGRDPTMLENFSNFINDKLNPLYGISDKIRTDDVLNIYQQYAYRFAPDQAFRSLNKNDPDANRMWAKSEKVFDRIAELMNLTYNYKHTTRLNPETDTPEVEANFALPKLIYLLGNGLINAREPAWSMLFVELANEQGIEAVKDALQMKREGEAFEKVWEKYPVNLNPTNHVIGITRDIPPLDIKPPKEQPKESSSQEEVSQKQSIAEPPTTIDAASVTTKPANIHHAPQQQALAS